VKKDWGFLIFTKAMREFWEDLRKLDGPRRLALATRQRTPHLASDLCSSRIVTEDSSTFFLEIVNVRD